jgi:nitronate monooxygenase
MTSDRFTSLVGCELPIQQAPMGGVASSPELATAVANAGGMGMVAAIVLPAAALESILDRVAAATAGPWGVNFIVALGADRERVELAAERARLVDFFWGWPDRELVYIVHAHDALAGWQVGSAEEAEGAEEAGCDVVVAQGVEAGGHVRGSAPALELLDETLEAVDIPVVAAGGIATRDDADAALAAGADAVRVGTRFIAADEADAHPSYVEALIAAGADDTTLTKAFHVLWPDAQHRVLSSSVAAAEALDVEVAGDAELGGERIPIPRFAALCPTRSATGSVEAMALYAGRSIDAVRERAPASEIVRELVG